MRVFYILLRPSHANPHNKPLTTLATFQASEYHRAVYCCTPMNVGLPPQLPYPPPNSHRRTRNHTQLKHTAARRRCDTTPGKRSCAPPPHSLLVYTPLAPTLNYKAPGEGRRPFQSTASFRHSLNDPQFYRVLQRPPTPTLLGLSHPREKREPFTAFAFAIALTVRRPSPLRKVVCPFGFIAIRRHRRDPRKSY